VLAVGSLALGAPQVGAQPANSPAPTPAYPTAPVPDPLLNPTASPIAPDEPTARTNVACVQASPNSTGELTQAPWAQAQLRFEDAWPLSTGAGVRVAVIDTGVNVHPRFGNRVQAGGDYVSNTPGTTDCDGHGTIVAGIIGAAPDPTHRSAFAGVAPEATIISIRQTSKYYDEVARKSGDEPGYGNLSTLARSVMRAVDLNAKVINISEAACGPATRRLPDGALGAALKYAADHDVVVVAAAGNTGGPDSGTCKEQNARSPAQPGVPGRSAVTTIASPAWYSDYVLAVGAVARDGSPSKFSLAPMGRSWWSWGGHHLPRPGTCGHRPVQSAGRDTGDGARAHPGHQFRRALRRRYCSPGSSSFPGPVGQAGGAAGQGHRPHACRRMVTDSGIRHGRPGRCGLGCATRRCHRSVRAQRCRPGGPARTGPGAEHHTKDRGLCRVGGRAGRGVGDLRRARCHPAPPSTRSRRSYPSLGGRLLRSTPLFSAQGPPGLGTVDARASEDTPSCANSAAPWLSSGPIGSKIMIWLGTNPG